MQSGGVQLGVVDKEQYQEAGQPFVVQQLASLKFSICLGREEGGVVLVPGPAAATADGSAPHTSTSARSTAAITVHGVAADTVHRIAQDARQG